MAIDEKVLIERLENREKYYHECALDELMKNGHTLDAEGFLGKEDAYTDILTLVKDLASEHNNGFCEWSKTNACGMELIREPHRMYLFKERDDKWEYCPYCGKEIKVIPAPYRKGE